MGVQHGCSLFWFIFDEFPHFRGTCKMPGVARTPEGCVNDKANQRFALLSSLLSFFCMMAMQEEDRTPICDMEKGRRRHPGHP